jgi:hypothetical protein
MTAAVALQVPRLLHVAGAMQGNWQYSPTTFSKQWHAPIALSQTPLPWQVEEALQKTPQSFPS